MERFRDLDAGKLRDILKNGEAARLSNDARERCEMLLFASEKKQEGTSVEDIMEEIRERFGVSETTVRRWLKRFDPNDPSSVEDESKAPKNPGRKPESSDRLVELIEHYRETLEQNGPRSIRQALKEEHDIHTSASNIYRVLRRKGKNERSHGENPKHNGSGAPGAVTSLFLIAVTAALSFAAPHSAEAAGTSTSFQIDFDSLQTGTREASGDSFTVIGGLTNITKAGAGESFQITPYGFLPAAETTAAAMPTATPTATPTRGGSRGGTERMAEVIKKAYKEYRIRIGDLEPEETVSGGEKDGGPPPLDSPVIRSYRERLLATVDGRRVIYRDVTTDKWYTPYVAFVVGQGIAHGYETEGGWLTGVFGVGNPVTKAEALKMTLLATGKDVPAVGGMPFNRSAQGTWAEPYVRTAEELHLSDYPRHANVHEPQTRAGVVRTIMDVIGLPLANKPAPYTDVPEDHPDNAAIVTASFYDLISGFPDGTFRPQDFMNRAAAAKVMTMVRRMLMP